MKKLILFLENSDALTGHSFAWSDEQLFTAVSLHSTAETQKRELLGAINTKQIQALLEQDTSLRTSLVLPANLFTWCRVAMPTRQKRQMQKALPYLVEDSIAIDPEECFIATGLFEAQQLSCAVMDKEMMSALAEHLKKVNWQCEQLLSLDNLLAATHDGQAGLHVMGEKVILLTEAREFFSCPIDLLDIFLDKFQTPQVSEQEQQEDTGNEIDQALLQQEQNTEGAFLNDRLNVFIYKVEEGDDTSLIQQKVSQLIESYKKTHDFSWQPEYQEKSLESFYLEMSETLAQRKLPNVLVNFFQGEFKVKASKSTSFSLDVNWKPAAALFAGFILLWLISVYVDTAKYKNGAELAELKTQQIFGEIFPGTRNYSSMKNRVAALLGNSADMGDNHFLSLLVLFGNALKLINADNPEAVKIQRLQFEKNTGDLKVDVMALDFNTLNKLKQHAQTQGIELEISSTSNEQSGVKGRLKVVRL